MKIEIRDDEDTIILSNDELDNANFVEVELLSDLRKDEDSPRGFVGGMTVSIEDLKAAIDSFWWIRGDHWLIRRDQQDDGCPREVEEAPSPLDDRARNTLRDKYKDKMGLDDIGNFSEGRAWVRRDGQMWFIKEDGTDLSGERYDVASAFSGGRSWVVRGGQMWHIKEDGTDLSGERYDEVYSFSDGRAVVSKGERWWFIKEDGTDLSSERYDEVYSFYEGRTRVRKKGQWWFIDIDGNKIEE